MFGHNKSSYLFEPLLVLVSPYLVLFVFVGTGKSIPSFVCV